METFILFIYFKSNSFVCINASYRYDIMHFQERWIIMYCA